MSMGKQNWPNAKGQAHKKKRMKKGGCCFFPAILEINSWPDVKLTLSLALSLHFAQPNSMIEIDCLLSLHTPETGS